MKTQKQKAVKEANEKLSDLYKAGSELADALVGHLGKDSKLSKLIRNKRDSMAQEQVAEPVTAPTA